MRLGVFVAVAIGMMGTTASEALEAIAPLTLSQTVLPSSTLTDYLPPDRSAQPTSAENPEFAQNAELGCRQTNVSTGVYVQPNLDSASRGLLTPAQTVRLESKGEGWARINQPLIGWVQSRYLTPAVSCSPLNGTIIQNPPEQPMIASPPEVPAPNPEPVANNAPVKATCDVLPVNGLVVRSEPVVEDRTYLTTIAPGSHEFQFTPEVKITPSEAGDRRWVYITAPATGWITLGLEGTLTNLGGAACG
ncbi:MAG: SH3 domain-containing protein [Leptolyngbyaceae cyanobacterium CSU_1_4]|nr:SH3 domain-containing protein [Leptolyngbyaceae cyanobacterium CSU_1_4]